MKSTNVLLGRVCTLILIIFLAGCGTNQSTKVEKHKKISKPAVKENTKVAKDTKTGTTAQQTSSDDWLTSITQSPNNLNDTLNPLAKPSAANPSGRQTAASNAKPTNAISPTVARSSASQKPTAKQLLGALQVAYSQAKTLKVAGTTDTVVKQDGKIVNREKDSKGLILFKRPDKFLLRADNGEFSTDGKTFYMYSAEAKRYTSTKMDKRIIANMASSKPSVDILGLLIGANYLPSLSSITLLNDSKVGKNDVFVISLHLKKGVAAPPDMDVSQKLWIGKKDLGIYKNVVVMRVKPSAPKGYKGKLPKIIETTISNTVTVFQPNIQLADAAFKFHPPAGAKPSEKPKDIDIMNKPAPDFSFKWIDGSQKKMSDFLGQTVMLYYFALPMNEKHLPVIQSIYDHKKDSMKIIAINLNNNANKVDEFLKSKGFSFPVVHGSMEIGKIAGEKYGVRGLPTAFIINKSGIVSSRITGVPTEKDITAKLEIVDK